MSDAPDADEGESTTPTRTQDSIITSDEYPMRVLAGAGTGKTFTMVRKIRHLLDDGVPPEEILALTFTNKAADSIREKLVSEIGPVANDIDAYTYHSIGETILRDHAYRADLDPRYEIATDVERIQFIYESLDEIPHWFTSPRVATPDEHGTGVAGKLAAFVPQMKGEGIGPEDLQTYLGDPEGLIELDELVDRLEERAGELLDYGRWRKPTPERLADDMIAPLETYRTVLGEEREQLHERGLQRDVRLYLGRLQELCDELIHLFETRQEEVVDGPLKPTFRLPALLFNAKYSDGDATGLPNVNTTPLDRLREVVETCQAARDLTEGYAAYERRLREGAMVDFADLVTRSRDLFETAEGEDDEDDTPGTPWRYVFCDEFQDTDTVQFDLVAELVGDGNLFVVGDTYQAIYEWRGANIDNIEQRLTAQFDPTDATLAKNFRSYKPILEFANDAFRQHPGHDSINELVTGEAENDEQDVDRGIATITAPPDEESGRSVIDDEGEATLLAEAIMQLLSGETDLVHEADLDRQDDDREDPTGYRPEDIAILVRANRHARPIIEALETAGIPYSLDGALAAESVGVRTVIAYLKVISNPERDDSLNRVLTMRYRLHDADLRTLNVYGDDDTPLSETLLATDLGALDLNEPGRIEAARDHLEHLLRIRDSHSLVGLYEELKQTTDLEWFLTESERNDLAYLDEVVAEYGRERVQPELSEEFIEFLQYNATAVLEGRSGVQDQPDTAEGAVNIMTIHKSKGLEFPVVFLPQLTGKEWDPRQQSNAALRHALGDERASPFDDSLVRRDEFEQRRAFHVAVTRAQNLCVLCGRAEEADDEGDAMTREEVADLVPAAMEWCLHPNSFPVWETVQTCLSDTAVDWTDEVAATLEDERDDVITTEAGTEMSLTEAYETVLSAAEAAVNGHATRVDPGIFGLPETPVEPAPVDLLPKHSYTSISAWEECQRRHYLDRVVGAFDDPNPTLLGDGFDYEVGTNVTTTRPAGDVSRREVGELFHRAAEGADQQTYTSAEDRERAWRSEAADRPGYDDRVREEVRRCIGVFFDTEAADWRVRSTERWFDFTYQNRHRIVGRIDAVCETPTGEIVIVDYKTGSWSPEDMQYQLPIYLYAANRSDMIDRVDKAAYVYVNEALETENRIAVREHDPKWVHTRMQAIATTIDELERSTYVMAETDARSWCYECGHRSLPCSDEFEEGT